ncbi:MAG: penicillin acylase family protein [Candidatus Aminicenantes bacterium]|nr:penicillin acylase family protein [Candidatus Aminicenantes bacterium]
MKNIRLFFTALVCLLFLTPGITASVPEKETLKVAGISAPVTIIKDPWGIAHIYAQNQRDLFFAQGYSVAKDRLFQLEIWRRQATGTLSEILGPRALKKDIGARLFKARVDMKEEMNHYHPDGEEIITSFVRGINAYIDSVNKKKDRLPMEFRLLGIRPGHWTPEVVVSRHNGLFRNAGMEVAVARTVHIMGSESVQELLTLEPEMPNLESAEGMDLSLIPESVLELYTASRSPVTFLPEDIVAQEFRAKLPAEVERDSACDNSYGELRFESNNWVVSGRCTFSGFPFMANDPHRMHQIPSLRYWAHLNGPGWNVIGGGEPCLPGISIGHNEYGAWGLTIFSTDQEDIYVYDSNPSDRGQYKYKGTWETMTVIQERIPVKGQDPVLADLKFTRHGPVLYEDRENNKIYALRAAWLEIGGSPYLASLRMDQAKSWEEFRHACSFSNTPSENMVWADAADNIGWQAVGITPLRHGWSGLLPVPGDGRFEWDGYLPIKELPHILNPAEGFFATANQNNVPRGYPHIIGFIWSDPFRFSRITEVLGSGRKFTMTDMMELQYDFLSLPARTLVPLLKGSPSVDEKTEKARRLLLSWNFVMSRDSVEATIYQSWERRLSENVWNLFIPEKAGAVFPYKSLRKMIDFLTAPDSRFGPDPVEGRDTLLIKSLEQAVHDITERLGPEMEKWSYGQEKFHHIRIKHLLSDTVNKGLRHKLDVGPEPQGGNSYTVNNTTGGYNQTAGASFRLIADLENWDRSLGTNAPGQSGDPDSPHYSDLFRLWAKRKYFPVLFSKDKILSSSEKITFLEPGD